MKKWSLQLRLTLISVFLLLSCCLGLTAVLSQAAWNMADAIEATIVTPAITVGDAEASAPVPVMPVVPSDISQNARNRFLLQSWLYMFLIVAAGGLTTWFITGKALRPLKKLSEEMENRTAETLSKELPVPKSHDEIASLTRSFNDMSRKLGESFSAQKRFAQSAAHELRTPLTVLKAKVDVFSKRTSHTQEEYDELLRLISRHTNRMTELVQDLLGLTNLNELPCNQRVALFPLLTEVVQELTPLAAEHKVSLSLNGREVSVAGNSNLLHRVFANLVENAVKYNVPRGSVDISMGVKQDCAVIQISDTGPGIPEHQKVLIFEPFYRVDKSRSRQMGGAGLGLATVKAIVDKHGGTITVADAPSGGSVFTVHLKSM